MDLAVALGMSIKTRREALGVSQERLARAAGLHRTYLGGIERGERNPSLRNLLSVATALDVPLSVLCSEAEAMLADFSDKGAPV